jgi:hypothetical protein
VRGGELGERGERGEHAAAQGHGDGAAPNGLKKGCYFHIRNESLRYIRPVRQMAYRSVNSLQQLPREFSDCLGK